ncbi:MAG: YdcF family protein [Candidatus Aenigmarchaeota archaeon]|nr:YdcF family protein [Candidatus Aenigmarchaeota archaeon]
MSYTNFVVHGADPRDLGLWRVEAAADRYHRNKLYRNHVIVTFTGRDEAEKLADIAMEQFNVRETDIRHEKMSRTTGESLYMVREHVLPKLNEEFGGLDCLYLVSQNWHERRFLYCAGKLLPKMPFAFTVADDRRSEIEIKGSREDERKYLLADKLILGMLLRLGITVTDAYDTALRIGMPQRA